MCSHMIVCALYPRFELLAALGDRRALLAEPAALAPEAGREQVVGEVSAPAEAFGIVRGMRLGEAMSRCPALRLVPPDPEGVRSLWNGCSTGSRGSAREVESDRAGAAFFEADGLHGHPRRRSGRRARRRPPGARAGRPLRRGPEPLRVARGGPAGAAAAGAASSHRGRSEARRCSAFLAPLPVALLRTRPELQALPEVLERLGIRTLGELAALPVARGGRALRPSRAARARPRRGRDTPLEPRRPPEPVIERLDLPEAASGQQLERALELLIARVLARRERRGRSLRGARGVGALRGGRHLAHAVTLRHASADPARIRLALAQRLAELPAPAESLALEVEAFGPPAHDQGRLLDEAAAVRRARLGEAVRQARQAAGAEAALRVLDVDPDSRIPERRAVLAPFPDAS